MRVCVRAATLSLLLASAEVRDRARCVGQGVRWWRLEMRRLWMMAVCVCVRRGRCGCASRRWTWMRVREIGRCGCGCECGTPTRSRPARRSLGLDVTAMRRRRVKLKGADVRLRCALVDVSMTKVDMSA
jgi:hypothetical protein